MWAAAEGERDDFFAEQRGFLGDARFQVIAESGDEQRGPGLDLARADNPAASTDRRGVARGGIEGLVEHPTGETLDDGAGPSEIDFAFVQWHVEAPRELRVLLERLPQGARGLFFVDGDFERAAAHGMDGDIGDLHGLPEKAFDLGASADGPADGVHLDGDEFGFESVLGVAGAAGLFLVASVVPLLVQRFFLRLGGGDEIKGELIGRSTGHFPEKSPLEKGFGHVLAGARHGH